MTVLITGASGFVGLNIAEALLARGRDVVLFSRSPPPEAAIRTLSESAGSIEIVSGDVRERRDLDRAFADFRPQRVVHGAAVTPGACREGPEGRHAAEVNILGALTALEAARDYGVERFVLLSSASVYGGSAVDAPVLDEAATVPAPEAVYPVTKFAAEKLGLRLGTLWGVDVVACRIGSAFGPWERDTGVRETLSAILQVTRLALKGGAAILPRPGRRDWIYSRDVAGAVVALLDAPKPAFAVYNVGLGAEWTVAQWCARLAEAFPAFSYGLAERGVCANVDYHGDRDRAPLSISRLVDDLGFRPRHGLDEAFADYLGWLRRTPEILSH